MTGVDLLADAAGAIEPDDSPGVPLGDGGSLDERALIGYGEDGRPIRRGVLDPLQDPVWRSTLGRAARITLERRYSLKAVAPRLAELLHRAAATR